MNRLFPIRVSFELRNTHRKMYTIIAVFFFILDKGEEFGKSQVCKRADLRLRDRNRMKLAWQRRNNVGRGDKDGVLKSTDTGVCFENRENKKAIIIWECSYHFSKKKTSAKPSDVWWKIALTQRIEHCDG